MARLDPDILHRVEELCDRVVSIAETLDRTDVSRRVIDQLVAAGTSIGANIFEADEAMSRADFCKSLSIAVKEANETRFWLRLIARRKWIPAQRLQDLEHDVDAMRRILGAMISRTKNPAKSSSEL